MKRSDNNRNLIVLVGILIVLIGAYFFLVKGDDESATATPASVPVSPEVESILGLLQQLQTIHIDAKSVSELNAGTLINFHQPITPGPRGKVNPFAH
jgi:hypothetical protein